MSSIAGQSSSIAGQTFEWKTKRDAMRIEVSDEGYLRTLPPDMPVLAKSEGYAPAEFDRLIEISGERAAARCRSMRTCSIKAMPDFMPLLPWE